VRLRNGSLGSTARKTLTPAHFQREDILVKHGIIRDDEHVKARNEALTEAKQRTEVADAPFELRAAQAPSMNALDTLEDDAKTDSDDVVLAKLREARIQQMRGEQKVNRFGEVERIGRDEFMSRVKDFSARGGLQDNGGAQWVVIELIQDKLERSRVFSVVVDRLAKANPATKFVRMVADHCIEHWPDANVPSVFAYYAGELKLQVIGPLQCQTAPLALKQAGAVAKLVSRNDDAGDASEDDDDLRLPVRVAKGGARDEDDF